MCVISLYYGRDIEDPGSGIIRNCQHLFLIPEKRKVYISLKIRKMSNILQRENFWYSWTNRNTKLLMTYSDICKSSIVALWPKNDLRQQPALASKHLNIPSIPAVNNIGVLVQTSLVMPPSWVISYLRAWGESRLREQFILPKGKHINM